MLAAVLDKDPLDARALEATGHAAYVAGRLEEAESAYQQAVAATEETSGVALRCWLRMGSTYLKLGKADDARLALARLGPARIARFFAFRALLEHGARLAFGSDWPIVSPDPLLGIRAAVTGLDLDGHPFATEHSIGVGDALVAYTRTAAEMLGLPGGMLREGRAADLVVLDRSPFEVDWTRELPKVDATIVGGRTVFERLPILRALPTR